MPITILEMIPKAGKVDSTQDCGIVIMLTVTTGLLLLSYCPIWGKKNELYTGIVRFLELQKRFKRNEQPR